MVNGIERVLDKLAWILIIVTARTIANSTTQRNSIQVYNKTIIIGRDALICETKTGFTETWNSEWSAIISTQSYNGL